MSKLTVELCPETGICSVVRPDGTKADLLPDEVAAVREARGNTSKLRAIVAGSDAGFAGALSESELKALADGV
jgi:hypothetical protein